MGEVSGLAHAPLLHEVDGRVHLLCVPRRLVVAGRAFRYSCAAAHGDQTDCETLRAVVLAQGQEPLRQGDRRKLVHERTLPGNIRTAACSATTPRVARPSTPLLVQPSMGLSRRYASTPTSNFSPSVPSAPRL